MRARLNSITGRWGAVRDMGNESAKLRLPKLKRLGQSAEPLPHAPDPISRWRCAPEPLLLAKQGVKARGR